MSRKRFDEFYRFDGNTENLIKKLSDIKISGTSSVRQLGSGGFFFGIHDNNWKNKRMAVVFNDKSMAEKIYNQLFGVGK